MKPVQSHPLMSLGQNVTVPTKKEAPVFSIGFCIQRHQCCHNILLDRMASGCWSSVQVLVVIALSITSVVVSRFSEIAWFSLLVSVWARVFHFCEVWYELAVDGAKPSISSFCLRFLDTERFLCCT